MAHPASGKSRKKFLFTTFIALLGVCGTGISTLRLSPTAWAAPAGAVTSATPQPAAPSLQVFLVAPGGTHRVTQEDGTALELSPVPILTHEDLDGAQLLPGESLALSVHLRPAAVTRFAAFTGSHLGERLAIVLEGRLLAAPVIKSRIAGSSLVLSGAFPDAMRRLAATLNAGRPSAPQDH